MVALSVDACRNVDDFVRSRCPITGMLDAGVPRWNVSKLLPNFTAASDWSSGDCGLSTLALPPFLSMASLRPRPTRPSVTDRQGSTSLVSSVARAPVGWGPVSLVPCWSCCCCCSSSTTSSLRGVTPPTVSCVLSLEARPPSWGERIPKWSSSNSKIGCAACQYNM